MTAWTPSPEYVGYTKRTPQLGGVHRMAGGFLYSELPQRGGSVSRAAATQCGRRLHSKRESYGERGGPGEAENSVGLQAKADLWGKRSLWCPSQLTRRQTDLIVGNGDIVRASTVGGGNGS